MNDKMFSLLATAALIFSANGMSLDGSDWKLSYRDQQNGGDWKSVTAEVPGNVHVDLERAGVIANPMIGTNVFGLYWMERCEWKYEKAFARLALKEGERAQLRFDGVDTRAEYWLNGQRLGASENMFVPVEFDITDLMRESNELTVMIASPLHDQTDIVGVLGRNRIGGTDVEGIRKAMHTFGWDIMPRLVSAGIWKSVTLEAISPVRFVNTHWLTHSIDVSNRTAKIFVDCDVAMPFDRLHCSRLRVTLKDGKRIAGEVSRPIRYAQNRDEMNVSDIEFWWPRDAGNAKLYDGIAEVLDERGNVLARDSRRVGIRTIRLERRDWHSEQDPGTFRFLINGVPIYMHGCDWSPMDALHSRDRQHLDRCLEMLVDLNCNMIRIWGGGVYEDDRLYDFCDSNGILVWQDFMMGNFPPEQNDRFAAVIESEARYQVLRLRSHPSLAIWCGNNEIDRTVLGWWGEFGIDPAAERLSREILPRVLRDFDPLRPYVPSSPWVTSEVAAGKAQLSQDHLWGPRAEWFKGDYWCNNTPTFVSEMGCHGCPNYASLGRMMSAKGLYPWPCATNKFVFGDDWNCKAVTSYPEQGHGVHGDLRNSLMVHQVKTMFGRVPDDLGEFAEESQIYQAQALKYWIELFRSRKGRTWGLLWWNLRDGWPIISDGVVDYWFGKKKAYAAIRSVQQPQLVTLVENGRLVAVNDRLYPVEGRVAVKDVGRDKTLFDREVAIPANGTAVLSGDLNTVGNGAVRISYSFEGIARENVCLYGAPPFDLRYVR